jgi:hypothetical protein
MRRLGIEVGPGRRKASEAEILEQLLVLGWTPRAVAQDRPKAEAEAAALLARFVQLGLGFEQARGERLFDPAELANLVQWANLERNDPFWSEQSLPLARAVICAAHGLSAHADDPPPRPSALPDKRFTVRFRRHFGLAAHSPGAAVRLRLPLPIEDEALGELEVALEPAVGAVLSRGEARIDARVTVPAYGQVVLGYEASFIARAVAGSSAPPGAEETALYTRPREGLISVDATARALAQQIGGDASDPWVLVTRIWRFVMERFRFSVINYEELDTARPWDWLLDNVWCDCQLGAALLATLCRAKGIPARMLSGYVLDRETPYFHYWAEAWVEDRGWVALDTMSWPLSRGGRDRLWEDYFFGQVDHRMKTEQLPRLFSGAGAIRFPAATMRLARLIEGGLRQSFYDNETRALLYADELAILTVAPAP